MYSGVPLIEVSTNVETLIALANLIQDCITYYLCRWKMSDTSRFYFKGVNIHLPKVTQFHHPTVPQQYILWFHVTMKNAMRMQIIQS